MKVIETIPYYLVDVRFQDNEIQIYDMLSKKVIASEPLNKTIVALRKVESQLYLALNEKDEIVSEISISIKLISKKSELKTEAGYILNLHMDSPSHGYYFGYYEMGEFKLTKDAKLAKIRSSLVQNCTTGRVTKSKNVYIGCRENDKHYLVKLNWKSNKDPKVLWKKAIPSAVMAMEIIEDRLFIGLKNGFLQLWDIQKDECIKNIGLFSSTISVLTTNGENITLASQAGDVARISKNGLIQWKTKITTEKIVGIYEDKDYLLTINTIGEQFHIKFKSGKPLKHGFNNLKLGGNAGLSSSIIKYRERFVITGYGGIWAFRHRNSNNSIHQYMGDPLMRIIHQHPFGFYSGDDNGSVCFWGLGDIKIKVENYEPPLKNYQEYKKLKLKSLGRPKRKKKRALKLMKTAQLRIEKLETSRSGRSLCYVDQSIMESLGIATGDIIEIIGKKRTAGIVVASFSDKEKDIIRIDGIQRINVGSTIGEFVKIQPTFAPPAREIELASTKEIYDIKKQEDIIKVKLINKPIMAGDLIDIHRATSGPLRLLVLNIKPIDKVVIFTRDTRIVLHKNFKSNREKLIKTAQLRIEKLEPSRSGRSLCYVDQSIMESLGIATGDIIEIVGKKRTAGIVVASFSDKGKQIIRIDGIQRLNLGSTIGEFVTIQPTLASPAREIELAPTKAIYNIKKQADVIKGKLIDKPIMAGDIIDIPGAFIKSDENYAPMNGFMKMLNMGGGSKRPTLGPLRLIVLNTKPTDEVVRFTRETRVKINKKIAFLNSSGSLITSDDIVGLEKDPEEEIYCQYCGMKLTKEEQLTHSCKKKPEKNNKL